MLNADIDTKPLQDALNALQLKLGSIAMEQALMQAAKLGAAKAESVVSPYPPVSGKPLPNIYPRQVEALKPYTINIEGSKVKREPGQTYMSKFPSKKAQGGFFYYLGKRTIRIPYRRTGTLGRSITSKVRRTADAVYIDVGTNVSYAPLVIGKERQAAYHRGNWTPLQDDIENNIDGIRDVIITSLVGYLRKRS